MTKNKRLLINNLGESHKAFALDGSSSSENKFIWNNNIKKIEKLHLNEEVKVHKVNSLKSAYSKLDFREWKKHILTSKRKILNADLKVRYFLYNKGILTLDTSNNDLQEVYSDVERKTSRDAFIDKTNQLIIEIEKIQNIITETKSIKRSKIQEGKTKSELVKEVKEKIDVVKTKLDKVIETYLSQSINVLESKAIDFETTGDNKQLFTKLVEEYKSKKSQFVENAKKATIEHIEVTKNANVLFNYKSSIKRQIYKLELAKQEVDSFRELAKYNWEFKYKYDIAEEIIKTMPIIIKTKLENAKKLLEAKENISLNGDKDNSESIKQEVLKVKKDAKESIKDEVAKLKISGASKNGLKTKKAEIKHNLKTKIRDIKLKDEKFAATAEYKFLLSDLSQKISYEEKILESNIQEIRKRTPIEISRQKYWISIFAGIVIPGLNSLINKQWVKAGIQITATALFAFILSWVFGAFESSKGNGIIGLTTFGATNGELLNGNDSRFYIVMGSVGIIFLVAAFMFWVISALNTINVANLSRAGIRYSNWKDQKRLLKTAGLPYLLSAPALIFILFIVVLPLLATLLLSFTNFNQRVFDPSTGRHIILNGTTYPFTWVGGEQFEYITKVVGTDFTNVFVWTILWTIFATFLTMFLGTLLAILVNQNRIKGKTFFRIIYILPWAIPAFLTILFFSIFFAQDGTFNHIIGEKIFGRSVNWKTEVTHEKALLIFLQGWLGQSYMFLLVTGMLQSIPKSLYEAARVDGSKPLQQFRTITMPIIVMQIAPLLIGQFTFNFNNFGIIYLFNGGGPVVAGHSAGETDIFLSWVFRMVNNGVFAKPGAGAALSLIVSVFVVTPSAFIFFRSKSFRGGNF